MQNQGYDEIYYSGIEGLGLIQIHPDSLLSVYTLKSNNESQAPYVIAYVSNNLDSTKTKIKIFDFALIWKRKSIWNKGVMTSAHSTSVSAINIVIHCY